MELESRLAWPLTFEQVMEAMPNMLGHSAVSGGQGESWRSHVPTKANVEDTTVRLMDAQSQVLERLVSRLRGPCGLFRTLVPQ